MNINKGILRKSRYTSTFIQSCYIKQQFSKTNVVEGKFCNILKLKFLISHCNFIVLVLSPLNRGVSNILSTLICVIPLRIQTLSIDMYILTWRRCCSLSLRPKEGSDWSSLLFVRKENISTESRQKDTAAFYNYHFTTFLKS